jgi:hypothetical protein
MKIGDLVKHNDGTIGLITEYNPHPRYRRFPYFICFNDYGFNDWYGPDNLEVISENR